MMEKKLTNEDEMKKLWEKYELALRLNSDSSHDLKKIQSKKTLSNSINIFENHIKETSGKNEKPNKLPFSNISVFGQYTSTHFSKANLEDDFAKPRFSEPDFINPLCVGHKQFSKTSKDLLGLISSLKSKSHKTHKSKKEIQIITTPNHLRTSSSISTISSRMSPKTTPSSNKIPMTDPKLNKMIDLCGLIGYFSDDLNKLIDGKFDNLVEEYKNKNLCDLFNNAQYSRINVILDIIDKIYMDEIIKEAPAKEDLWMILKKDINKCINAYSDYTSYLDDVRKQRLIHENNKQFNFDNDIINILNLILDYGAFILTSHLTNEEYKIDKIRKYKNDIYIMKINNKSLINTIDPMLYDILEKFESYFNNLYDIWITKLNEIDELNIRCEKYYQKNKELIAMFEQKNQEYIKYTKEIQILNLNPKGALIDDLNKHYKDRIIPLENEILRLKNENDNLQSQIKGYKLDKIKISSTKSQNCQKGIQVDLNYLNKPRDNKLYKLSDILSLNKESFTGASQSIEWITCLINLLYSDKLINDLIDDHDKRCRKTLKNFTIEWFLKKFGLYSISDIMLKDLVHNVKIYAHQYDRVKLFSYMCGISSNENSNSKKGINIRLTSKPIELSLTRETLKKEYFMTTEAINIFLRVLCNFKSLNQSYKFGYANDGQIFFNPILSFWDPKSELVSFDIAQTLMHDIFNEVGIKVNDNFIQDKLTRMQQDDPCLNGPKEEDDKSPKIEVDLQKSNIGTNNKSMIRFDYFVLYLMEIIAEQKILIIEKFYTSLQIINKQNTVNIAYEDFYLSATSEFPNKSQLWYEYMYAQLLMNNQSADKIPLANLIKNIIPLIYNNDIAIPSYNTVQSFLLNDFTQNYTTFRDRKLSSVFRKNSIRLLPRKNSIIIDGGSSPKAQLTQQQQLQQQQQQQQQKYKLNYYFCLDDHILNNICLQIYDTISSLYFLNETYSIIKQFIIDNPNNNHVGLRLKFQEEIDEDLLKLKLNSLKNDNNYEGLIGYSKLDAINYIELIWKKMRWLMQVCFKNSKNFNQ